jgi:hypothetical protein
MMRKILIVLSIISFAFFFSSCSSKKGSVITSAMLEQNITSIETKTPKNEVLVSDLSEYWSVNTFYLNNGLIIVVDTTGKRGVWSLFTQELICPLSSDMIYNIISAGAATYVKTTNADNEVTVYDVFGQVVLPTGLYVDVNIDIEVEWEEETPKYYEIVDYSYFDEGNFVIENKIFSIDIETKTRSEIENPEKRIKFFEKTPLSKYGLDGYYLKSVDSNLYIYNSMDKLINHIYLDDPDIMMILDGKLFVQKAYRVEDLSDEYTYLNLGSKYFLKTYTVDLTTGKEKELNVDYLINNLDPILDSNGDIKYGKANVRPIVAKNLSSSSKNILINSKGEILTELVFDICSLRKLSDTTYYDPASKYIINEKLEPQYTFAGTPSYVDSENIFILQKNKFGILDATGKVLIPFEYFSIMDVFLDGKTIATDADFKKCILDINNKSKVVFEEEIYFVSRGLIYTETFNENNSKYEIRFLDYNKSMKESFEYSGNYSTEFKSFANIYGSYLYAVFDSYYVLVETTLK